MRVAQFQTEEIANYPEHWDNSNDYFMELNYDANGNITDLYRYGLGSDMDQLTYNYNPQTNQLNYIRDAVSSSGYPYDITDQSADNYQYDAIGNTLKDVGSDITNVVWSPYGKVTEVQTKGANIYYQYDGLGRRVRKRVEPVSGTPTTTWYILDAGGRNISTYTRMDEVEETQQELSLYGGSRLGLYRREVQEWGAPYDKLNNPWPVYTRFINRRQYEITDHLGSTRVVVNDRALVTFNGDDGSVTYACADVLSLLNYYPGGQLQPGMSWENTNYRYGYNTQERSDEIYGPGNFYTAEFWEYDSRIWRRWNRDPVSFADISVYAVFFNNPIFFIDPLGAQGEGSGDPIKVVNLPEVEIIAEMPLSSNPIYRNMQLKGIKSFGSGIRYGEGLGYETTFTKGLNQMAYPLMAVMGVPAIPYVAPLTVEGAAATATQRMSSMGLDFGSQFAVALYKNNWDIGSSLVDVNYTSMLYSGVNPGFSYSTLMKNGLISSSLEFNGIGFGSNSMRDVGFSTAGNIMFGRLGSSSGQVLSKMTMLDNLKINTMLNKADADFILQMQMHGYFVTNGILNKVSVLSNTSGFKFSVGMIKEGLLR